MSLSDVNSYITLKNQLLTQINTDDTIANIQSTINSLASKKTDILNGLASSTVLDTDILNSISTSDKINFISIVQFCKYGDSDLNNTLMILFDRVDLQLTQATDPDVIVALRIRISAIIAIIKATVPQIRQDLLK